MPPGANGDLVGQEAVDAVGRAFVEPIAGDNEALACAASSIHYIADNAGEMVIDRPPIAALPAGCVTVAVRGTPAIIVATMEDDIAAVIDNGSDTPGTEMEDFGGEFLRAGENAGPVISRGRGNCDALCDEK